MTLSPFDNNSSKMALPIPSVASVMRAVLFNKGFMLKICVECKNYRREKILLTLKSVRKASACQSASTTPLYTTELPAENLTFD